MVNISIINIKTTRGYMFILESIPIITLYIFWLYIILGGEDEDK
tara:strand:- start:437 stop:568 length:132 start_codon:yes stop_codon:yes gene_type:complete